MPNPPLTKRQRELAKTRAIRKERVDRREGMLEDVVGGIDYSVIAARHKVSLRTVRREVAHALDHRALEAPHRYLRVQVERLNRAIHALEVAVADCDTVAIASMLKVMERLDLYHGVAARLGHSEHLEAAPLALTDERTQTPT